MNKLPEQLLLQALLIFFNAFFAMTEIALISLSTAKLKKMAEGGDRTAGRLLKMVEEPSGFLSTIQIGITLAGFLGSAFAAENFSEYLVNWIYVDLGVTVLPVSVLNTLSVIVITIILSYFTLIFGELVPKRIAMQKPMEVARISCPVVSFVAVVMKPVVWFLSVSTNLVLKALRLKTESEEETVTEEEIRMMVDIGEEKGTIESEEKEWIENVFEFGDSIAKDCMTHVSDLEAVQSDMSDEEIEALIKETGLSRLPVYGEDIHDILGILYTRDFLINRNEENKKTLSELLRPAYFVPETIRCADLFKDLQQKKIHLAIAVNEYGEVSGIITMEDLLEEIVGNIYDEFDPSEPEELEKLEDNLWRSSGSTDIDTIGEQLDMEFPENLEYDTLGGMVFSCLHTIPKDGTEVEVETQGLHIKVTRITNRKIEEAIIWKVKKEEEPKDEEVG